MSGFFRVGLICILSILIASCATLFYGSKNPVLVVSNPEQTPLYINNEYVGETPLLVNQSYSSGNQYYSIRLSENYEDKHNVILPKKFRPISLIGLPAVVPFAVDFIGGAAKAHEPMTIFHNFEGLKSDLDWPYKVVWNGDSIAIDPLRVYENPLRKMGMLRSKTNTPELYASLYGYGITGVYDKNDPSFQIGVKHILEENPLDETHPGKEIEYFTSYSIIADEFSDLLAKNSQLVIEFSKVNLNKLQRIERKFEDPEMQELEENPEEENAEKKSKRKDKKGKAEDSADKKEDKEDKKNSKEKKGEGKNEKSAFTIQGTTDVSKELVQFWPVLTEKGSNRLLFQAFRTGQGSQVDYTLGEEYQRNKYYFMFVLENAGTFIEISDNELFQSASLFSSNPHFLSLCKSVSSGIELQNKLNRNPANLTNILGWHWSKKSGDPFMEILNSDEKKTKDKKEEKPGREGKEPALVADGDEAKDANQKNLNEYSNTMGGLRPKGESTEDQSEKFYGPEAPWYLQGQLKPEYRQSAKQLGYETEEFYDPTPKKIDSTAWLKEKQFELVPPDLKPYTPGYDPGYINEDDPRKKPTETEGIPWYLKKPTGNSKKPSTGKKDVQELMEEDTEKPEPKGRQ